MSQQGKPGTGAEPASMPPEKPSDGGQPDPMAEYIAWAVSTWPQIDPDVEGIVSRMDKIGRYLQSAFRASLGQAGLTKEEWRVIIALSRGVRSHGWLCRDLDVSTGAMTNRLDKLEDRGLIKRTPDPDDRRGVLLELTEGGRERLDGYVDAGASREKELLSGLSPAEKRELNALLSKLLLSLQRREPDPR
jgi:DNA-binding MarR family transcriptional regulator